MKITQALAAAALAANTLYALLYLPPMGFAVYGTGLVLGGIIYITELARG